MSSASADQLTGQESDAPADLAAHPITAVSQPECLRRERTEQFYQKFLVEYEPVGPSETVIVRHLARCAAATERWGQGAEAIERQAAFCSPLVVELLRDFDDEDAVLAQAMSTEVAERAERQSLGHARAFQRSLKQLIELQTRRKHTAQPAENWPTPFLNEAECVAYLIDRFRQGKLPCARCQGTKGFYLPTRMCWECGSCHHQVGLRHGTVMARSALSLCVWFDVVRWLLCQPTIQVSELANKVNINRLATVRRMAKKIRDAMIAENASELLAGLDLYWLRPPT